MDKDILKPLLKYPGGKSSELKVICQHLPEKINRYIEPFVGGGAVYFFLNKDENYINDKSVELMLLYEYVQKGNKTFFEELNIIVENWKKLEDLAKDKRIVDLYIGFRENKHIDMQKELKLIIDKGIDNVPMFTLRKSVKFEEFLLKCLNSKFNLIKKNEIKKSELLDYKQLTNNLEAGIKASYYTYLRDVYNKPDEYDRLSTPRKVAIYLFIREYCYSAMFRFNRNGEFNVPYGGVSYNKKTLETKIKYYKSKKIKDLLAKTKLSNNDFYEFIKTVKVEKDDFMFLDPPYDTTFSEYDKNSFGAQDQIRLADYLVKECKCKFLLVIKKTDFIYNLYKDKGFTIIEEDKNYYVSFKNRNVKAVKHLIIKNY